MDVADIETMVSEMETDANAIRTIALDVSDYLPAGEDAYKLYAIVKLADDQLRLTKEISKCLITQ